MTSTRKNGPVTHGRKAMLPAVFFAAVIAALALTGGRVIAGTFQITPTLGDVPPGKSTAVFQLKNPAATPITVQVRAFRWTQSNNEDTTEPADDLIVVPPLVTIPAGGTQVVRIAAKQRDAASEAAYRVHFHEIPPPPPPGFVGLQTALKLDVPLFFAPGKPRSELRWMAERTASGALRLRVRNTGNRFARFAEILLKDSNGRVIAQLGGPQYALAGNERTWEFSNVTLPRGAALTAVAVAGDGARQEIPIKIE